MLKPLYERDLAHSFVIWAVVLAWFSLVSLKFLGHAETRLEHFMASQSFWLFAETPREAGEVSIVAIERPPGNT